MRECSRCAVSICRSPSRSARLRAPVTTAASSTVSLASSSARFGTGCWGIRGVRFCTSLTPSALRREYIPGGAHPGIPRKLGTPERFLLLADEISPFLDPIGEKGARRLATRPRATGSRPGTSHRPYPCDSRKGAHGRVLVGRPLRHSTGGSTCTGSTPRPTRCARTSSGPRSTATTTVRTPAPSTGSMPL